MVKGHQHGVLHLVVPAAIAAGTLLTWHELQLELNEVVLLAWTIAGPLHALLALILPILGGNPELRLYLFLFFICPTALLYFFGDYLDFNDVSLLVICVAPAISFFRVLHSSLKVAMPDFNGAFWAERLPEVFTLLCVGVLPVVACAEFGLMGVDDATLLFFCVFAPVAFAILNSPALKAAREAVSLRPHSRATIASADYPLAPRPRPPLCSLHDEVPTLVAPSSAHISPSLPRLSL